MINILDKNDNNKNKSYYIGLGIVIGAVISFALDNILVGVRVGIDLEDFISAIKNSKKYNKK